MKHNLSSNHINLEGTQLNAQSNVMNRPERGFLLSRNQYDKYGQCVFELWVKSDSGIKQLIIEDEQPTCFGLAVDQESIEALIVQRKIKCQINHLALQTFRRQQCIALYSPNLREYQKLRRACQDEGVDLFEDDIKPIDRYLMERFIQGSMLYTGHAIDKGSYTQIKQCRIKATEFVSALSNVSIDIECDELGHLYSIGFYSDNLIDSLEDGTSANVTPTYKKVLYNLAGVDSSITLSSETDKHEYIEWCDSETRLLQRFVEVIQTLDPDLLIGWNFVKFDMRVLFKASQRLNVKLNLGRDKSEVRFIDGTREGEPMYPDKVYIAGRTVLDGIEVMKNATYNFSSFSLDFVSNALLDDHKLIQGDASISKLEQIKHKYRFEPVELAEYNLQDCKLVADIFRQEKLTDFLVTRTRLTGLELERVGGSVAAFTNLYLPHVHRKGWIAPNLVKHEDYVHSPGGYVMESIPGIHDDVLVFDFKSLYPSIMRTFNIDPIALIEAQVLEGEDVIDGFRGGKFSRPASVLSNILDDLWKAREQAKSDNNKVWSNAIKIIMNSFYGVLGSAGCRFYDTKLASSITMRGHWILNQSKAWFEQKGLQVIYGDTDSIFVSLKGSEAMKGDEASLEQALNQWWTDKLQSEFALSSKLEIEFETHFSPFFMPTIRGTDAGSKKRYAGMKVISSSEKQLIFKGLESVRSDWTELAKVFQTRLFELVFNKQDCDAFVRETLSDLKSGKLDHLLVYKKRIRRKLEHYLKTTPPHIKAARFANMAANSKIYGKGVNIEYLITTNGPRELSNNDCKINYQHYVDKQLFPIAESILAEYSPKSLNSFNQQMTLL